MTDRTDTTTLSTRERSTETSVAWLRDEFPGWDITVAETTTGWNRGDLRPLWIARRDGHHPQAELTAAKLHTRLSDYLDREERRQALAN